MWVGSDGSGGQDWFPSATLVDGTPFVEGSLYVVVGKLQIFLVMVWLGSEGSWKHTSWSPAILKSTEPLKDALPVQNVGFDQTCTDEGPCATTLTTISDDSRVASVACDIVEVQQSTMKVTGV
jgi:hypothetical protein